MADSNVIGDRGESIFQSRITENYYFRVYYLGEKAPIVDFLLEIREQNNVYYCFVQVKSTERGYDASGNLNVRVSHSKYKELLNRPLPTYVAGVDILKEIVYICPAFGDKKCINGIPQINCLKQSRKVTSKKTLMRLKQDVINYWLGAKSNDYKKKFTSSL